MKRNYLLLLLLVLFVGLRIPSLYEPFGRDQGIYATVAVNLLEGGTPYKDVWDHKPPGIYFMYALAFAIFGRSMVSIPLLEIFYFRATLLIFYRVARTLCDEGVAALGLAIYVFLSSGIFYESWWGRGQAEVFMVLPIMGMVLCLHEGGRRGSPFGSYLAAGALAGCALLLKQTCLPLIILAVVYTGLAKRGSPLGLALRTGASLRGVSSFVIGLILPLGVVAFCFWMRGGLGELFQAVVVFNLQEHVGRPFDLAFLVRLIKRAGVIGTGFKALWVVMLVLSACGLVLRMASLRKEGTLFLMWTVGSFLSVCIGWWLFPYHFILLVPPLSLLAAYGVLGIFRWMASQGSVFNRVTGRLVVVAFCGWMAVQLMTFYYTDYLGSGLITAWPWEERWTRKVYDRYEIVGFSFSENQKLSSYLAENSEPDDTVFIWGWDPLVYFLAERRCASRFIFIYPLLACESSTRDPLCSFFLRSLEGDPPGYFVVARSDMNAINHATSEEAFIGFEELKDFVEGRYVMVGEIGRFIVFSLIDEPPEILAGLST